MKPERHFIGRRDFVRAAGMLTAGAALGASAYAKSDEPTTFKKIATIPVDIPEPAAIAVGEDNTIFVAAENVVCVLDPAGKEVRRIAVDGHPQALLADKNALLFATRNVIIGVDLAKGSVKEWARLENDDKAWITSIAADDENIYVADFGNRVVLRFDKTGKLINRIGGRDASRDIPGFIVPSPYFDVAVDPMGALWVANPGKHGLESYRPNGDLISSWYRAGMGADSFCGCCNPAHIAFLSDHSLVTVEKGLNRVKVLAPDTTLKAMIVNPTPDDIKNAGVACTEGSVWRLAVTPDDRVMLLDQPGRCIHVYGRR